MPRRVRRLRCPSAGSVICRWRAGRCGRIRSSRILGVPEPTRAGPAGGVAVAAPVGGLAVRPRHFHPPPAATTHQQPGEEIPVLARRSQALVRDGAAGGADALGGDEVGLAGQRRVGQLAGDDPSVGQVPPLDALVSRLASAGSARSRSVRCRPAAPSPRKSGQRVYFPASVTPRGDGGVEVPSSQILVRPYDLDRSRRSTVMSGQVPQNLAALPGVQFRELDEEPFPVHPARRHGNRS
jgi:hypothetical protein